jgi:methylthioribose-1-phosphate isomerase
LPRKLDRVPAIGWVGGPDGHAAVLDQTLLPGKVKVLRVTGHEAMRDAIRRLAVRGAPAIGIAAAYGVVLAARRTRARSAARFRSAMARAIARLESARPTAVNLSWALRRMERKLEDLFPGARELEAGREDAALREVAAGLLAEARAIHAEDEALCEAIGRHGAALLRSGWNVLTHCNAGALATGGSGTALAVVYSAAADGKDIKVFADETRPLLQGARLTSWELRRGGIDVTLICDGAAASVIASGKVQCVVVGADRIARNGDTANKIGTYGLAVLAREHGVPFYVAAPGTTFDLGIGSGSEIPIEERPADEVARSFGKRTAPEGVAVYNPAFDVTPARYITGIITERGVIRPPYTKNIARAFRPGVRGRSPPRRT